MIRALISKLVNLDEQGAKSTEQSVAYSAQFEDEFRARVSNKIGSILENGYSQFHYWFFHNGSSQLCHQLYPEIQTRGQNSSSN